MAISHRYVEVAYLGADVVRRSIVWILVYALVFVIGVLVVNLGTVAWVDGVGSSLIAAGLAGWITLVWVTFNDKRQRQLEVLSEFGIVDAFPTRSVQIRSEYTSRLKRAKTQIDVMGFGLRNLREDLGGQFAKWAAQANVRVLLIDPEAPVSAHSYADQRDVEEGATPGTIGKDVRAFVQHVGALDLDERFQIRLYQNLPSVNIFRVDDEMFFGPYLVGGVSRNLPTLILKQGGVLFEQLSDHFDRVWDDFSKPA